jgi:hypothetical protein
MNAAFLMLGIIALFAVVIPVLDTSAAACDAGGSANRAS